MWQTKGHGRSRRASVDGVCSNFQHFFSEVGLILTRASARAVQVDPIKPRVERIKTIYDELLSNIALNFNLRCYSTL